MLIRLLSYLLLIILSLAVVGLTSVLTLELLLLYPPTDLITLQTAFMDSTIAPGKSILSLLQYKFEFYTFATYRYWPIFISILLGGTFAYILSRFLLKHQESKNYMARIHVLEEKAKQQSQRYANEHDAHSAMLARVEALYNQSSEAYLLLNTNGNIEHINPAAERFFKVLHSQETTFINRRVHELMPSFAETGLARLFDQIVQKKAVWQGELQLQDTPIWLNLKIIHAGEKGIILIFRDVSHNHSDIAELKNTSALSQEIINQSPHALAVLNQNFEIQQCSSAFSNLLQKEGRNLNNKALEDFVLFERWDVITKDLAQGKSFSRSEEKVHIANQESWLKWSISPWQNVNGQRGGYLLFLDDITEFHNTRNRATTKEGEEHAMAYQDALTGLPNRQLFNDRLNMALAQAYRQLGKLAIFFLDLDGFKAVNDSLGHEAGDILLQEVSNRLQRIVRDTDTVARLGGDEFTIILNIREPKDATIVANKIIESINQPYDLSGKEAHVSTSIGIAMYPLHGDGAAELIKKADTAMYAAKTSGKNQFVYYNDDLEKSEVR